MANVALRFKLAETMQTWINKWADQDIYAGAGNQGAMDAWYDVALSLEEKKLRGEQFCGGTADIMKFSTRFLGNWSTASPEPQACPKMSSTHMRGSKRS